MLWLFWSPHMTQWTKFVNGKRISSYWFVNAKCIHLWMKSYGVTIDYFKSWKLLSATFLFSVYYAVQGGSTELSSLRTKSYSADVQMKATERYFRIFLLSFNRKIRRKMNMSWWVKANFFSVYIGFHRNCAGGWDLRRSASKCSPFTKRFCSENNAWDNLWVFVICYSV